MLEMLCSGYQGGGEMKEDGNAVCSDLGRYKRMKMLVYGKVV